MSRRAAAAVVAANVSAALTTTGVGVTELEKATGIPAGELQDRLHGETEFTWGELQDAGGLLAVSPASFFKGVAHV